MEILLPDSPISTEKSLSFVAWEAKRCQPPEVPPRRPLRNALCRLDSRASSA